MNNTAKTGFTLALVFGIAGILATGCSHISSQARRPEVNIGVLDPDRIRFSGKGAGAGMMMAGAMGPMGIAIGVAIDEGIGKDIDATAHRGNDHGEDHEKFSIESLLMDAVNAALDNPGSIRGQKNLRTLDITVERYGFITAQGEGDLVQPQLHVSFVMDGDNRARKAVRIPEDFKGSGIELNKYPLDSVKADVEVIRRALTEAAVLAVDKGLD